MNIQDMMLSVQSEALKPRTYGESFIVVGASDESAARRVGPMMARVLKPERRWGEVLHCESTEFGWEVVVEDRGAIVLTTARG